MSFINCLIKEMARPYKVDRYDVEDIIILAKELGVEDRIDPDSYDMLAQRAYQIAGRGAGWDEAAKKVIMDFLDGDNKDEF
jgi:hypothetical protein